MGNLEFIAMAAKTIGAPNASKERTDHQENPQHRKNDFHSMKSVD